MKCTVEEGKYYQLLLWCFMYCGPALLSNMTLAKFTKEAQLPNLIYITATYLQVLQFRSKNIPITYYKLGFEQYQNTSVYYITWKVLNTITRRILDIEYWQSKLIKAILHMYQNILVEYHFSS